MTPGYNGTALETGHELAASASLSPAVWRAATGYLVSIVIIHRSCPPAQEYSKAKERLLIHMQDETLRKHEVSFSTGGPLVVTAGPRTGIATITTTWTFWGASSTV